MTHLPKTFPEKLGGAPHSKQSLRLWLRMLSCTILIENTIRNRLAEQFSTTLPRFDVLSALERHPDGLTMGELSRFLMVSNGNVTGLVSRLEADGFVVRSRAPKDRRTHYVKLTDKGMEQFKAMAHVHENWIDEMFASISVEEENRLMDDLRQVQNSVIRSNPEKNPS
ncbi:MarR family transcriptional regulator [Iodidimonas muriae]|uniref:MarR family transcriptional regulator n=1 Tax=Iodidimonas muriae TaxID=261467 RepID=A0ABQ2LF36_9PROT|nr:MarR family transcriptional regulator [Iodidimonas muriae]GER07685.1 MarR family transcriptional regulator [Kordiimonadales bacterium JCM 17843]GGO14672.1 MarR family transcriptional regulator [Iodidimonas muriae]